MNRICQQRKIEILSDKPIKVLISICLPLVLVNVLSIFTTSITNDIYSKYVGQMLFTIMGLLSLLTTALTNVISSIASAGWIKTAVFYSEERRAEVNRYTINVIYTILSVELICMILLLSGADPILHILNIPDSVFSIAKKYYYIYIISYTIVPIGHFLMLVVNGIGKSADIFFVNCVNSCGVMVSATIALIIFRGGLLAAASLLACNAFILIAVCLFLMKRNGIRIISRLTEYRPDLKMIWEITCYGLVIAMQVLICNIGYLCVAVQTNKYLSLDYISVLNVSLPLDGVMLALSSACMVFVPQNHGMGKYDRVKKFFTITLMISVISGVIAFIIHALIGEWYYGRLFDNQQIIAFGKEYWFWNGLGYIFVAVIYVVRNFFDAVGLSKIALISGVGELAGNMTCAFWLIPKYGNIGRNLSSTLGWFLAAVFLLTAYALSRRRIYIYRERENDRV